MANPLGAMPHENLSDLRRREIMRMTKDIDCLREGCLDELRWWQSVRERMFEIGRYKPDDKWLILTKKFLDGTVNTAELKELEAISDEAIVSSIVRLVSGVNFSRYRTGTRYIENQLNARLLGFLRIPSDRIGEIPMRQILLLCRSASNREIAAAFYSILIHTRFNSSTLRGVKREWVNMEEGIFTLKGYKSKIDQETGVIDVTKDSVAAYEGLKLVIWNFDQLKRYRHIRPAEQRLWFGYGKEDEDGLMSIPLRSFEWLKARFTKKFGMAPFTDDQVRTHMMVLDRISDGRRIADIRDGAGHQSESTTGIYFSNITAQRQSSSMNLEFQRRIDATIKFSISDERPEFSGKFDPENVDKNLVFPIGDGTSCETPFSPPDPAWLIDGVCDAKNCHVGEGCSKNKITIGRKRILEIWATSDYYAKSWRRLLNENEEAFHRWHAPSMLFNLALKRYVMESAYWSVIEPIVRSSNEGDQGEKIG